MVAYAYSTTLCADMKCYVLMVVLILGVIGYIIVEVRHKKQVSLIIILSLLIFFVKTYPNYFLPGTKNN